jgi:hypothetical protein
MSATKHKSSCSGLAAEKLGSHDCVGGPLPHLADAGPTADAYRRPAEDAMSHCQMFDICIRFQRAPSAFATGQVKRRATPKGP